MLTAGGWGPAVTTDAGPSIPNRDVLFLNNVVAVVPPILLWLQEGGVQL